MNRTVIHIGTEIYAVKNIWTDEEDIEHVELDNSPHHNKCECCGFITADEMEKTIDGKLVCKYCVANSDKVSKCYQCDKISIDEIYTDCTCEECKDENEKSNAAEERTRRDACADAGMYY